MQTFLIVVGILFLMGVTVVAVGLAWLRKLAAKAASFVLRTGLDAVTEQAKADYAAPVRARLAGVTTRVNAVPTPSIWNAGSVILSAKTLGLELAEISEELDRLKAEDARAKANAITVEGTVLTPGEHLALPAPTEGEQPAASVQSDATTAEQPTKPHDEILAQFREEFVKPGNRGILDAWLTGAGEDTFIQYQLATDAVDRVEKTGRLSEVPHVYEGVPTLITWFPRQTS
jgi:hypothetical protein